MKCSFMGNKGTEKQLHVFLNVATHQYVCIILHFFFLESGDSEHVTTYGSPSLCNSHVTAVSCVIKPRPGTIIPPFRCFD